MRIARLVLVFALASCGSNGSNSSADAASGSDGSSNALCTGAVYDPCTGNDQCGSMNCRLYTGSALQVCTQACGTGTPCPNDSTGATVTCNQMGSCKPSVANGCHR